MRGEKVGLTERTVKPEGSPPHARGKEFVTNRLIPPLGITPACAGKRQIRRMMRLYWRDHPRMRGEKSNSSSETGDIEGSPPHARGKGRRRPRHDRDRGITPACAGKRQCRTPKARLSWDHPRMRGEKQQPVPLHRFIQGSPPHARGKDFRDDDGNLLTGITPACAGKR